MSFCDVQQSHRDRVLQWYFPRASGEMKGETSMSMGGGDVHLIGTQRVSIRRGMGGRGTVEERAARL